VPRLAEEVIPCFIAGVITVCPCAHLPVSTRLHRLLIQLHLFQHLGCLVHPFSIPFYKIIRGYPLLNHDYKSMRQRQLVWPRAITQRQGSTSDCRLAICLWMGYTQSARNTKRTMKSRARLNEQSNTVLLQGFLFPPLQFRRRMSGIRFSVFENSNWS